jgi:hypothetical protein
MKSREEIIRGAYEYFLKSGAPYLTVEPIDASFPERYAAAPRLLHQLWRTLGLGMSHNALVQFCDPADFAFILDQVLGDDAQFRPGESIVFAYTAFGRVLVWNTRWGSISIDLPTSHVVPFHVEEPTDLDPDRGMAAALAGLGLPTCDRRDSNNKPLFERAVKRLGAPAIGEIYGFFPARLLGGGDLKHLRRTRAAEHFSILIQLSRFTLIDARHLPVREIRTLG